MVSMDAISHQAVLQSGWLSHHVSYNSRPGDQLLRGLVLPVVRDLWSHRRFLRFFFIRYWEGGPHIRLRFLCFPEDREEIHSTLTLRSSEFFGHGDSPDAAGLVVESPFDPETQRYGGSELLEHSLEFFCLTSAYVLQQIGQHQGMTKSKLLALALRALVRQMLGFATDENELARLVGYAADPEWELSTLMEKRADQEFESRKDEYLRLLAEEIEYATDMQARSRLAETMLTDGALLLSRRIRNASDPVRFRILSSQLHMTWNRMGIRRLEEIYLGRILWRAVGHVVASDSSLRSSLADILTQRKSRCEDEFETLVSASLAQLVRSFSRAHSVDSARDRRRTK